MKVSLLLLKYDSWVPFPPLSETLSNCQTGSPLTRSCDIIRQTGSDQNLFVLRGLWLFLFGTPGCYYVCYDRLSPAMPAEIKLGHFSHNLRECDGAEIPSLLQSQSLGVCLCTCFALLPLSNTPIGFFRYPSCEPSYRTI